jgi:8-oxo-dGTP pyrophosphatase MutT (NUDIX family)
VQPTLKQVERALRSYKFQVHAESEDTRWAGVAVILREDSTDALSVLLIRRSENPNDPWSGHMAMPGGRLDPGDATTRHAAERETMEEVGLDLNQYGRWLGRLDDVRAVARGKRLSLAIAPWVYVLEHDVEFNHNHEVQETVWVPVSDLIGPSYRDTMAYDMGGTQLMLPCWRWNERVIWGLTYGMLDSLFRIVGSNPTA